jgi:hypothetical protein
MQLKIPKDEYPPILVIENFFDASTFEALNLTCRTLPMYVDARNANRLTSKHVPKHVDRVLFAGIRTTRPPIIHTEYRRYFEGSDGFDWHRDTLLESSKYYECVLTMDDTSDCRFEFVHRGKHMSIKPKPNTLVMVRPVVLPHRVTKLNYGSRTILKFVACL